MVRENRIKVLSTQELTVGAGLSTNYSTYTDNTNGPVNGLLQAVKVELDPSGDIEIYNLTSSGNAPALTIHASGTDLVYPRVTAVADGGGDITNSAVEYVLKGNIGIDVTNVKAGSATEIELWYK